MGKREKIIIILSLVGSVIAGLLYIEIPTMLKFISTKNGDMIGIATNIKKDVRIRSGTSINWISIDQEEFIYKDNYIFTDNNSQVTLRFFDKSTLSLRSNSLVHLNFDVKNDLNNKKNISKQNHDIEVMGGEISASITEGSSITDIKVDNETNIKVKEGKGADFSIKVDNSSKTNNAKISVSKGSLSVNKKGQKSLTVKKGEQLDSKGETNEVTKSIEELKSDLEKLEMSNWKRRGFKDLVNEVVDFFF